MGQKVNPHGFRVGVIKDWDSRWYARNEKVGDLIVEDQKIRKFLKKTLYGAGVPKIEIERDNAKVRIFLHCARPGMVIGDNVIIHANAVIGSDGFGNAPLPDGTWEKIEHLGNVIIGNNVEIGAGTTIDRSEMESTIIGNGVKIDNLCQIAHNVQIGDNTVMAAQCGIAGSTKIGKNCILAGQVGIAGHLEIADNTTLGAQAGVIGSIKEPGQTLLGSPAINIKNYMRSYAVFRRQGKE